MVYDINEKAGEKASINNSLWTLVSCMKIPKSLFQSFILIRYPQITHNWQYLQMIVTYMEVHTQRDRPTLMTGIRSLQFFPSTYSVESISRSEASNSLPSPPPGSSCLYFLKFILCLTAYFTNPNPTELWFFFFKKDILSLATDLKM